MTGPTQWDLQVRLETTSQLLSCAFGAPVPLYLQGRGDLLYLYWLYCGLLCLSLAAVCTESEYLGEVSVLQLVLETPGTIALQTSVDLLETGEVHLCLMAPVCFWGPLTQAVVTI